MTNLVLWIALSNPNQFTLQPLSNIKEFHLVQLKIYVSVNLVTFSTLTASFFPVSNFRLVNLKPCQPCQGCHPCQIITRSPWPVTRSPSLWPRSSKKKWKLWKKSGICICLPSPPSSFKWTHCRCFHASRCFHFSAPCSCFLFAHIHVGHMFYRYWWMSCSLTSLLTKWSNVKPFTGCLKLIPSNHQSWYCLSTSFEVWTLVRN